MARKKTVSQSCNKEEITTMLRLKYGEIAEILVSHLTGESGYHYDPQHKMARESEQGFKGHCSISKFLSFSEMKHIEKLLENYRTQFNQPQHERVLNLIETLHRREP